MLKTREVRLFRNNRDQAVRIPLDLERPGDRALLRNDGDRLILEPVRGPGLLVQWAPLEETFPEIPDEPATADDVFVA